MQCWWFAFKEEKILQQVFYDTNGDILKIFNYWHIYVNDDLHIIVPVLLYFYEWKIGRL